MLGNNSAYISDGVLYYFGENTNYNFGDGTKTEVLSPKIMTNMTVKMVSLSANISLVLTDDGTLYGCGMNFWGGLIGVVGNDGIVSTLTKLSDLKFKYVSAGYGNSMAITEDGDLYTWGLNTNGKCGDGSAINKSVPTKIGNLKWKKVYAGYFHSAGITEDGDLYTWGGNSNGQIGDGSTATRNNPTKIGNLKWKDVTCSASSSASSFTLAITEDGDLYAWGYNTNGQLGDGTTAQKLTPNKIGNLKWNSVDSGDFYSAGITEDGDLYTWGLNTNGRLGSGTAISPNVPTRVGTSKWRKIVCGNPHMLGVSNDKKLYGWGRNTSGCLAGIASINTDTNTPKEIVTLGKSVYLVESNVVVSFFNNSILLKSNNKVYSLKSQEVLYETKMTSNTTPTPLVASASGAWNSTYPAWKAFNGTSINPDDAWLSSIVKGWVQINFGSKKKVNKISLTSRNNVDYESAPKDFNVLGSINGTEFKTLAVISNQTNWTTNETREFSFSDSEEYQYFRVEIINNNGNASFTAIGQIVFSFNEHYLLELKNANMNNFLDYGMSNPSNIDFIFTDKNYILQDTVSEDTDGLWKKELNRKPLSIKFE